MWEICLRLSLDSTCIHSRVHVLENQFIGSTFEIWTVLDGVYCSYGCLLEPSDVRKIELGTMNGYH